MKVTDSHTLKGKMRFLVRDSQTDKLLYISEWIENKIVSGDGYGRNLVIRQLAGDTTYPLEIDSAQIGTGTATPADSDTTLGTATATFSIADSTVNNDSVTFGVFMTDAQLANGTYTEFGLRANGRLFSRVLISPSFTKTANQNTTFEYVITLSDA